MTLNLPESDEWIPCEEPELCTDVVRMGRQIGGGVRCQGRTGVYVPSKGKPVVKTADSFIADFFFVFFVKNESMKGEGKSFD